MDVLRTLTPEAKQFGVEAPRGLLLLGVQGCGKSLAAKAVAKTRELPLLRLEPGRLFDKFVGESEKNLDRALATAERMAPLLSTEHILEELKATKPLSVTRAEEVEDLREWARGRAVPAS